MLGLRPPGLEFRIMFLGGSVISFISPSSGGSPGPGIQRRPKTIHSFVHLRMNARMNECMNECTNTPMHASMHVFVHSFIPPFIRSTGINIYEAQVNTIAETYIYMEFIIIFLNTLICDYIILKTQSI